jgi:hypothetical protein
VEVSRLKVRCLSKSYQSQGELFGELPVSVHDSPCP